MATRRFIAGAQCPGCGTFDTVFIVKTDRKESRHCTRCDLNEERPTAPATDDTIGEWQPVRLPGEDPA